MTSDWIISSTLIARYRSVLNDVIGQGLDAVVPEEFRELSIALDRMETLLDSDPFAARDMSRSLGGRFHGLPRFAREQRRSRQDAELAAAEAFRKAQQAEAERQLQMRSELEAAWREGLSGWSTPVALNAAFAELQQLRARLLGDVASNITSAQISAALREVRLRYEGDAERQLQEMKNRAQREAVTDVLTLQREQLEQEAKKNGGERAASGQQVLPIQCGSSAYAKRYLEYYNLRAVDAQEVGRNAFVSTGYSWDNTPLWRTSGKAVAAVLDSLSISTAVNQNTASGSESETAGVLPALLPQRDTGHLPDANAADAVKATVNFQSGGATGFVYDDALAAYGMLHADGTPQLDANTGTQAVFDNLLILYSGSSLRDDGRTLDYDLSMGGGVWLNGGHLWQITWTQGTQSTLALYDSNGKPLNLPAGRSYIALLSSLTGQELLVQSSSGEALVGAG